VRVPSWLVFVGVKAFLVARKGGVGLVECVVRVDSFWGVSVRARSWNQEYWVSRMYGPSRRSERSPGVVRP